MYLSTYSYILYVILTCIIFLSLITKDLEKQEELRIANINLKEHQEIIDELRRIISEKTDEISNMHITLENVNTIIRKDGVGQGGL